MNTSDFISKAQFCLDKLFYAQDVCIDYENRGIHQGDIFLCTGFSQLDSDEQSIVLIKIRGFRENKNYYHVDVHDFLSIFTVAGSLVYGVDNDDDEQPSDSFQAKSEKKEAATQ